MNNFFFLNICFFPLLVFGQVKMSVTRCADIDRNVPIVNIFMDENNNKWVADKQGIFLAQSPDFAKIIETPTTEWALLRVSDGNMELNLPKSDLKKLMGDDFNEITTAHAQPLKKELWIGTRNGGLYHFNWEPSLSLIEKISTSNSKLRSNYITTLFIGPGGRLFVGTDDGLMILEDKKSELFGKYFIIDAVALKNKIIWVVSDGEIFEVDDKGRFLPFELTPRMAEGKVVDIAFDSENRMWIASEVITRLDTDSGQLDFFGPAQDFTSQFVTRIAVDYDDALWVGTRDKGVYFIGKSSTLSGNVVISKPLGCDANVQDAALEVRASGGEPPYTYQWETTGLSGANPQNLGPGSYTVTIQDKKGTSIQAKAIIEDRRLNISINQESPASPGGGSDGNATINVTGGNGRYSYQWDNGETAKSARKLTAGKHQVTVSDAEGCQTLASIDISESLASLTIKLEQTEDILCAGNASGAIQATITGGQEPYSIKWNKEGISGQNPTNLSIGNYSITVTDAAGSSKSAEWSISEPSKIRLNISPIAAAGTNQANGKARADAEGGSGQLSFSWDNGETTQTAANLAAGLRSVTVTDQNGCQATASIEIRENILPLAALINASGPINCAGEKNISLKTIVNGGKEPYQFTWNVTGASGGNLNNIGAGNYNVTVTDAAGQNYVAGITVNEPSLLTAKISPIGPASTGGTDGIAEAMASGGSGKYTYKWDNGESSQKAIKLNPGRHTVTITDEKGCTTEATVEIGENILPLALNLEISKDILCNGNREGAIKASVSGGKPPFNYNWNNGGSTSASLENLSAGDYEVTVTDQTGATISKKVVLSEPGSLSLKLEVLSPAGISIDNGSAIATPSGGTVPYAFKWENGATTAQVNNLSAGRHSVTITDGNGCTIAQEIEVTENILPLAIKINQTETIKCAGEKTGAIAVEATGGKPPYQYQWSQNTLSGSTINDLSPGTYAITVSDASGLNQTARIDITEPAPLKVNLSKNKPATNEDTKDGKAGLNVFGGTPNADGYTYAWDNGETGVSAEKLPFGPHTVKVSDANGCSQTIEFQTDKKILPALTAGQISAGQTLQVSRLYFDADSTNMTEESFPVLDEIANFMEENPLVIIEVGGHTNNVPPDDYCDKLSTERAKSVATYIVKKGVDGQRVVYKGYGKRQPKYSNRTEDGRRRNQRVEIKILRLE